MTRRELIKALNDQESCLYRDDEEIMVSIIRDINDPYEAPDIVSVDYVGGHFINVHVDALPSSTG